MVYSSRGIMFTGSYVIRGRLRLRRSLFAVALKCCMAGSRNSLSVVGGRRVVAVFIMHSRRRPGSSCAAGATSKAASSRSSGSRFDAARSKPVCCRRCSMLPHTFKWRSWSLRSQLPCRVASARPTACLPGSWWAGTLPMCQWVGGGQGDLNRDRYEV